MRREIGMRVVLALVGIAFLGAVAVRASGAGAKPARRRPLRFDRALPSLGGRIEPLPPGAGKAIADQQCLRCHSGDMLRQQRLTEKQWLKTIDKMNGWGAEVTTEADRAALLGWLVGNFGPGNEKFQPVVTRPVGE